jgi:hypothetical protein
LVFYDNYGQRSQIALDKIVLKYKSHVQVSQQGNKSAFRSQPWAQSIAKDHFNIFKHQFDSPVHLTQLLFQNCSSDPTAGVKNFALYFDRRVIFQGHLLPSTETSFQKLSFKASPLGMEADAVSKIENAMRSRPHYHPVVFTNQDSG